MLSFIVLAVISLFIAPAAVNAHMNIMNVCVRGSFYDQCAHLPGAIVDWDLNAPIGTHDQIDMPFCRYTKPYPNPVATYKAGSSIPLQFDPTGNIHSGGHCQFAVSYDGGVTFVVLQTVIHNCFVDSNRLNFNIPLPATAPTSDKVVFAWSWNNAVGNREQYSNCWDARVDGMNTGGYIVGPKLLLANYGPSSPYIPEFPPSNDDGRKFFDARPTITVTYNGGPLPSSTTSSKPSSTSSTPPASSSTTPKPSSSSTPSTSSTSSIPIPTDTNCSPNGSYRCIAAGQQPGYQICSGGTWVNSSCSPGTVCKSNGGSIYCDFP